MKHMVKIALVFAFAFIFTGCQQLPQNDIDAAKVALENAQRAGVDRYLVNKYKEAVDAYDAAMVEIKKQDAKVSVLRSYAKAKKLLTTATTACEEGKAEVVPIKNKIKTEVGPVVEKAKAEFAALQNDMAVWAKNKKLAAALKDAEGEIKIIESSVNGAQASLNGDDYPAAQQSAMDAITRAEAVKKSIEDAKAKKGKKK